MVKIVKKVLVIVAAGFALLVFVGATLFDLKSVELLAVGLGALAVAELL